MRCHITLLATILLALSLPVATVNAGDPPPPEEIRLSSPCHDAMLSACRAGESENATICEMLRGTRTENPTSLRDFFNNVMKLSGRDDLICARLFGTKVFTDLIYESIYWDGDPSHSNIGMSTNASPVYSTWDQSIHVYCGGSGPLIGEIKESQEDFLTYSGDTRDPNRVAGLTLTVKGEVSMVGWKWICDGASCPIRYHHGGHRGETGRVATEFRIQLNPCQVTSATSTISQGTSLQDHVTGLQRIVTEWFRYHMGEGPQPTIPPGKTP